MFYDLRPIDRIRIMLTYVRPIDRRYISYILISFVIGYLLQMTSGVLIKRYEKWEALKKNKTEELLLTNVSKKDRPILRKIKNLRGGDLVSLFGLLRNIKDYSYLITGATALIGFIKSGPRQSVFDFFEESSHANLYRSYFLKPQDAIIVGESLTLDCNKDFQYLFNILVNLDIPYEQKKEILASFKDEFFVLDTHTKRLYFILCLISMLVGLNVLNVLNVSSYYLLLAELLDAVRKKKISKVVLRAIIRKLLKLRLIIYPTLLEELD